jgi:hypothetical protein
VTTTELRVVFHGDGMYSMSTRTGVRAVRNLIRRFGNEIFYSTGSGRLLR